MRTHRNSNLPLTNMLTVLFPLPVLPPRPTHSGNAKQINPIQVNGFFTRYYLELIINNCLYAYIEVKPSLGHKHAIKLKFFTKRQIICFPTGDSVQKIFLTPQRSHWHEAPLFINVFISRK